MKCWVLQDMADIEASCVIFVKIGMFDQLEQSKISVLTVTILGIVMATIQCDLIVSICFM